MTLVNGGDARHNAIRVAVISEFSHDYVMLLLVIGGNRRLIVVSARLCITSTHSLFCYAANTARQLA